MTERVNHPLHYNQNSDIECIDAIAAAGFGEGFALGNSLKYIWRHKQKNGIEDLKKAKWYLDWWINHLESAESSQILKEKKSLKNTYCNAIKRERSVAEMYSEAFGIPTHNNFKSAKEGSEEILITDDPYENA